MAIMPVSCGFAALLLMLGSRFYAADRDALARLEVRADVAAAVPATA